MSDETRSDTITLCANCGKGEESTGDLKACTACKVVKYCSRDCQIAHRPQHKKACKKRAAELHDEELFKDPPPREECPICMLPLPHDADQSMFKSCCGKLICTGCHFAMMKEEVRKGKKKEELGMCAFCRTPAHSSDEEGIERLAQLMDKGNAIAYYQFGCFYASGDCGIPQDWAKANELYQKAGDLGYALGYSRLGFNYHAGNGVEVDEKRAKYYSELAAMKGGVLARHNLGMSEGKAGNYHRAFKHFIIAAGAGNEKALSKVKVGFQAGYVAKDEYASTLRSYQKSQTEMKSEARDNAAELPLPSAHNRRTKAVGFWQLTGWIAGSHPRVRY